MILKAKFVKGICLCFLLLFFSNCVSDDFNEFASVRSNVHSFEFGYLDDVDTFLLTNLGEVDAEFSISINNAEYLTINPISGFLKGKDTVEVIVEINRAMLETGIYNGQILINTNNTKTDQINYSITHYMDEFNEITGTVKDVVFSRTLNKIIAITENPNELKKIDPETMEVESAVFDNSAFCIDINAEGTKVVVGFDGKVVHYNIADLQILNDVNLQTVGFAFDIIYAPNNWVYYFSYSNNDNIQGVNLATEEIIDEFQSNSYYRNIVKLHPNNSSIYGATTTISPEDIIKFTIESDTAKLLYDSQYHGDYNIYQNLWISRNGDYIFTRGGNIFSTSQNQNEDINYITNLENNIYINNLDDHMATNKLYVMYSPTQSWNNKNNINVYDLDDLAKIKTIELPRYFKFNYSGGVFGGQSNGEYGFFNEDGNKFYVVATNSINDDWGIIVLDVE